jgi:hypothetical protein
MGINYFKQSVIEIQEKFNLAYGGRIVFDVRLRQKIILAICHLSLIQKKIDLAIDKDDVRTEIQLFVRKKDQIHRHLQMIHETKENKYYNFKTVS